ncbi:MULTISPECIES: amino acid ABC transporter permease [unclassified Rhizobium]|uniref:amino acid ABC transporter permease n=1 Tax=unclassified Rhizobium TaxID=2613769 RepID=UPI001ADD0A57|nr:MULTISPECIES: amino acid ABC transporter permease [unclassified Rhizobium]MBO9128059.1 amino acid ABC transporter permease [Rhizobium sp. 16-488-2b]MBO9178593.1 amino acid ABC transporter permease [Rhizobium sp. 16-488-2a]
MSDQSWTEYLPSLLQGAVLTIVVTFIAMIGGTVIGFILAMMKMSSSMFLQGSAAVYGTFIRGLPLLVQVLLVYFALPMLTGIRMPAMVAGTVSMTLFTGAFMAEIIRSGIQSVDRGQMEAGRSIGFGHWQTMRLIIWPQAIWVMLPNIANQFSITLKDTSLLSVIGVVELTMAGQTIYSMNFDTIRVLAMVGVIYMAIYLVAERFTAWMERRISR